jgi:Uma2 family endonuclease
MVPERVWTDDEILEFSAANDGVRIERGSDGTILMMTPAGYGSNRRENYVGRELDLWAEKDGRGEAFGCNAGFSLPDGALLSPDAGWISFQRLQGLTDSQQEKFLPRCPEFVVEVLSPSDSFSETEAKMRQWMANGAELGWMIDPYGERAVVFRPDRPAQTFEKPEQMLGEGPVAGFVLNMARLWA